MPQQHRLACVFAFSRLTRARCCESSVGAAGRARTYATTAELPHAHAGEPPRFSASTFAAVAFSMPATALVLGGACAGAIKRVSS